MYSGPLVPKIRIVIITLVTCNDYEFLEVQWLRFDLNDLRTSA